MVTFLGVAVLLDGKSSVSTLHLTGLASPIQPYGRTDFYEDKTLTSLSLHGIIIMAKLASWSYHCKYLFH